VAMAAGNTDSESPSRTVCSWPIAQPQAPISAYTTAAVVITSCHQACRLLHRQDKGHPC
jgi:hypothetical protein